MSRLDDRRGRAAVAAHRHEQVVEQAHHLRERVPLQQVRAQGDPDLGHHRGGDHAAADDVADHEREAAVGELEDVVPVAADLDPRAGGEVLGAEAQPRHAGQRVGQHRALHDLGHGPLLGRDRVVDRACGAVAGELQQRDIVLVEVPAGQRADVHHADHAPLDLERHAEHRADAALAENRVDDVGAAQVLDHDRPHLGCDTAREPTRDGDLHALADLLLQAPGGAGDEHVAVLVEQQDRGGVGREDLADALEQRAERLLEREVAETRVVERLDRLQRGYVRLVLGAGRGNARFRPHHPFRPSGSAFVHLLTLYPAPRVARRAVCPFSHRCARIERGMDQAPERRSASRTAG